MKRLLIIHISLLLLSSPLIGDDHKGGTLYLLKNPSGDGYIWAGFGDKKTQPKYQGDIKDEIPNGLGILIFPNGDKYAGSWKDGKRDGQGIVTFTNGDKYVGEWKYGEVWNVTTFKKDGSIKYKWVNGKYIKQ